MLGVVGKIYARILVDRIRRVTGGLIGDEQRGFRAGSKREEIQSVCGFHKFGEVVREG